MTHITPQLAATHDHWFDESAASHMLPALRLWARHFTKHHPIIVEALEWSSAGLLAISMLLGTLIANA
jgi:hypothetical protein